MEAGELKVVGEQDGPVEQDLKAQLTRIIRNADHVLAAYLARVYPVPSEERSIALCLVTETGPDESIVSDIATTFAGMFGSGVHMDILFLRTDQETWVAARCRPFYRLSHRRG